VPLKLYIKPSEKMTVTEVGGDIIHLVRKFSKVEGDGHIGCLCLWLIGMTKHGHPVVLLIAAIITAVDFLMPYDHG